MATDPGISLTVRPPQIESAADAMQKNVSIADTIAQIQGRQAQTDTQRNALKEAQQKQADQDAIETAIGNNTAIDEDGQITTDHVKASASLPPKLRGRYMTTVAPSIDKELVNHSIDLNTRQNLQTQNEMALATELKTGVAPQLSTMPDPADPTKTVQGPDQKSDAQREAVYQNVKARWAKIDPAAAAQLPPHYDSSVVDPIVERALTAGQARIDKGMTSLQIAQAKKDLADAAQTWAKVQPTTADGIVKKASMQADAINAIVAKYPNIDPDRMDAILEAQGLPKINRTATNSRIIAMRKQGLDAEGKPLPEDQLSISEKQRIALQKAREDSDDALTDLRRAQANPDSPQYKAAAERARIAQENVDLREQELGLKRDVAQNNVNKGQTLTAEGRRKIVQDIQKEINTRQLKPGSPEAKAVWDEMSGPYNQQGANLPQYEVTQQPGFLASFGFGKPSTPPPPPVKAPDPNAPKSGAPVYKKGTTQVLGYFDGYDPNGKVKLRAQP